MHQVYRPGPQKLRAGFLWLDVVGAGFRKGIICTATAGVALLDRLVGRNLRLSRADPTPWFGQPSPLRCALLSPQGLTTLRGPNSKATWGKPQDPDAPERPPGRSNDLPERRLNGAYKVQRAHLPHPPCGARKNLRAARLLDFFDRYGCSASLHPPLAALGSAPPTPPPLRGRGRLGK